MTDLAQLRALRAKMTQGRWGVAGKTTGYISCTGDPKTVGYVHVATVGAYPDKELLRFNRDRWDADAAGIVALVNAAPALLASAARAAELEADNKRLEALVIGWLDLVTGPDEQGAYVHQRQLIEASVPIKARVCVRNVMEKNDERG